MQKASRWLFTETKGASGRVAVVLTMNSNKVNAINPEMLDDFEAALTTLECDVKMPVVLTGEAGNSTMCAGLDLAYLFGCADKAESRWRTEHVLSRLGGCVERLYTLPRPTVAALSGHALAGGAVIANACDFRVGVKGSKSGFGVIEVQVGVPFPAWPFITSFHATPPNHRGDAILYGKRYTHDEALAAGLVHELAPDSGAVVRQAVEKATQLGEGSMPAFAMVKEQMVEEALRYCKEHGAARMEKVMGLLYSDAGWAQIQATLSSVQRKK
jgi:enoyl-CoA hydratase